MRYNLYNTIPQSQAYTQQWKDSPRFWAKIAQQYSKTVAKTDAGDTENAFLKNGITLIQQNIIVIFIFGACEQTSACLSRL